MPPEPATTTTATPAPAPADNRGMSPSPFQQPVRPTSTLPAQISDQEFERLPHADRDQFSRIPNPDDPRENAWVRRDALGKPRAVEGDGSAAPDTSSKHAIGGV